MAMSLASPTPDLYLVLLLPGRGRIGHTRRQYETVFR